MQLTRRLRVGWVLQPPDCRTGAASVVDSLSYRCLFFDALNSSVRLVPVGVNTSLNLRSRLDVMLLPHVCTVNARALPVCLRQLQPTDPPSVIVLNKVFETLERKISLIKASRHPVALVITPSPQAAGLSSAAGFQSAFFPYAAPMEFGRYAHDRRARFNHDIGFSGGWQRLSGRYPFRKNIFSSNATSRLQAQGVRVLNPGWLPTEHYIRAIASTKLWLATSEQGAHVGPRFFEVMISGRALLICDRNHEAYNQLGIKENVHAVMFNSTSEFEALLHHYRKPENEGMRSSIVRQARELVLSRHLWSHRVAFLDSLTRNALERLQRQREEKAMPKST